MYPDLSIVRAGEYYYLANSTFEADAINLSNEALAALNTGDIEGIHAYGNSKMVVTKVKRS